MSTNNLKENKYLIIAVFLLPVMVGSSFLVSFKIEDALYFLFMVICAIRYIIISIQE